MKAKKRVTVHVSHFSWLEVFLSFLIMSLVAAVPGLLYGQHNWHVVFSVYSLWYALYWVIIALVFVGFTAWQRYRSMDRPLRELSDAAERVASGDFSVYLQPLHRPANYDYLDAMFANFNTMVAELGSIETLSDDFIANVSHEFKRPLANIEGYAQALQLPNLSEADRLQYTATIIQSTQQLSGLVTNVLRLNKLQNQTIKPQLETFDLNDQLTRVVLDHDAMLENKSLEMAIDLPEKLELTSDAALLRVVWQNLLRNAIKFTPANGQISLSAVQTETAITVSLQDTGEGMSAETQRHLFDKFYQGDSSHASEGNGLGMAMVAQILRLVNGEIQVNSELDQGSTFTVKLPLTPKK